MELQLPHGFEVTQAPSNPPVVFSGDKAVVYGILIGPSELLSPVDCTASLKGQVLGKPLEYSISFEVPGNSPSFSIPIIHHLAAKALIKDWERDGGDKKSEIVKLSVESSVVSSHTAFVAVDESNQPVKGAMKQCPAHLRQHHMEGATELRGGRVMNKFRMELEMREFPAMKERELELARAQLLKIRKGVDNRTQQTVQLERNVAPLVHPSAPPVHPSAPPPVCVHGEKVKESTSGRPLTGDTLVSLQRADGSWKLDDVIAMVLSKSLEELRDACPVKCEGEVATVWATVLCVAYLKLRRPSQKDEWEQIEWELIAMKADLWLDGQSLPAGADLMKMKEAARKIIGQVN